MTHLPPRRLLIRNGNCLEPCQEPLQPPTKGYATRGGKRAPRRHPRRFQGPQVTAKPRQMAPRWSPRRTKRPFQSTLNIKIAKCHRTLLFTMFYTHPGTPGTTNFHQYWELKRRPNNGPKRYARKVPANDPKLRPNHANVVQRSPKSRQDGSKMALKRGPRRAPAHTDGHLGAQWASRGLRRPFWSHLGANLEPFWEHFGNNLGHLFCPFFLVFIISEIAL